MDRPHWRPVARHARAIGELPQHVYALLALGRSRGGPSTKIHATVDALGNPLRWFLTGCEAADLKQAAALIEGLSTQAVVANTAYDADTLPARIAAQVAAAVIPPLAHRREQRGSGRQLYKDRALEERFFNRIKHFRRIATCYEKLTQNYLSMLTLSCTYVWLP